jgi:tetratricopeptide (TPR) repeat protein
MSTRIHLQWTLLLALFLTTAPLAVAKPFVPESDDVVVERLPEKSDPSLASLKRQRAALARAPADPALAAPVARRAIEAARATGDPRFLGQAQAALAPWWFTADAPPAILVLRATLKQSTHDFAGALNDLDRIVAARPSDGQALLTRATVLTVQGRYAEAERDCARLASIANELVATTCSAGPASLSGAAAEADRTLMRALARSSTADPGLKAWAYTLAAEVAARRGEFVDAEAHFQAALVLDRRDSYLLGAYADFLLDRQRAEDVVDLLRNETTNDALFLRLVLAEARLAGPMPDAQATFTAHRSELSARFEAARRRGDIVHRREEARYALALEGDIRRALALALANWAVQREPADLRLLAEAARSARDTTALATVDRWIEAHRLEDVTLAAIRGHAK